MKRMRAPVTTIKRTAAPTSSQNESTCGIGHHRSRQAIEPLNVVQTGAGRIPGMVFGQGVRENLSQFALKTGRVTSGDVDHDGARFRMATGEGDEQFNSVAPSIRRGHAYDFEAGVDLACNLTTDRGQGVWM